MLEKIGFVNAKEDRVTGNCVAGGVEDYLSMFWEGSPLGHSRGEATNDIQSKVIEKAKTNISRYEVPGNGVSIPAECIIVAASKPS